MICSKCGSNCANDTKFCPICGNPFPAQSVYFGDETTPSQPTENAGAAPDYNTQYNQSQYGQQYNQNQYNQNQYGQQPNRDSFVNPGELNEHSLPESLRPLSPWAYLGYYCLFSMVPCAGLILAFVYAFSSGENVNKRNFARFYLILLGIGLVLSLLTVIFITALGFSLGNSIFYNNFY